VPRPTRRTDPVRGLIALNAALLGVLALVTLGPDAGAQAQPADPAAQSGRQRGAYTMVGGGLPSGNTSGIWILDTTNQEMIAMVWDLSRNRFSPIGFRDLDVDAQARQGR